MRGRVAVPATRRTLLVGVLIVVVLLLGAVGLAINLTSPPRAGQWRVGQIAYLSDVFLFAGIGGFLALKVPGNVTGRALLVVGTAGASSNIVQGLLNAHERGARLPAGLLAWAAWLDNWTWVGLFGGIFVLLLYFPDGRPPGVFWRGLELSVYAVLGVVLVICLSIRDSVDYPGVRPAVSFPPFSRLSRPALNLIVNHGLLAYFFLAVLGVVAALLVRWRRSTGARRAQLKWLFAAAAVFIGQVVVFLLADAATGTDIGNGPAADLVSQIAIWLIPVAIGVAVTRHGLFEIDRIVSRTVSYAALVALLAGAYVAIVTGLSSFVPDRYGSVPVVLATLAASALFVPVRRRVVGAVDRRFNRSRYDAAVVVAQFAERVRGRAGAGTSATTGEDLVAAAHRVLQPAHATVWLAPRGQA